MPEFNFKRSRDEIISGGIRDVKMHGIRAEGEPLPIGGYELCRTLETMEAFEVTLFARKATQLDIQRAGKTSQSALYFKETAQIDAVYSHLKYLAPKEPNNDPGRSRLQVLKS